MANIAEWFSHLHAWFVIHMHPVNDMDLTLLLTDGLVCSAAAALFAFSPGSLVGERKPWRVRLVRYVLAFVYGFVAWRIWGGHYLTPVEPSELLANVVVLIQAAIVRGDVEVWFDTYSAIQARRREARRPESHSWTHGGG